MIAYKEKFRFKHRSEIMKIFLILWLLFFCSNVYSFDFQEDTTVYTVVEKMPEHPEGNNGFAKYLAKNVNIPEEAADSFDGKLFISFIVEKDGSLANITIKKGGSKNYNDKLIKVIQAMPQWNPGIHEGKIVRCQISIPINICFAR